jgi:hypothetical protein
VQATRHPSCGQGELIRPGTPASRRCGELRLRYGRLLRIGIGRWSWTGINGATATLWDWLHLLLLPTVVVPLLMPMATSRVDFVRPPRAPGDAADDAQDVDDGEDATPPPTVPEQDVSLGPESRRSASG